MSKIRIGRCGVSAPSPLSAKDLRYGAVLKELESTGLLRVPSHHVDARALTGHWPILGNDRFGCCTFAAPIRVMMNNAKRRGRPLVVTDDACVKAYLDSTGGRDVGAMPVNSLTYLRDRGVKCTDGTILKITAFARVNERDPYERRSALQTFKHLVVAAGLPARLDEDRDNRWELTPRERRTDADNARSLGGHAYPVFGFERDVPQTVDDGTPDSDVDGDRLSDFAEFTVPWDEEVVEEAAWTDYYREEAWVIVDNQETDEFLVDAMMKQLAVLRST